MVIVRGPLILFLAAAVGISVGLTGWLTYINYRTDVYFWTHATAVKSALEEVSLQDLSGPLACVLFRHVEPDTYLGGAAFSPYEEYIVRASNRSDVSIASKSCRSMDPLTQFRPILGTSRYFAASNFISR
jgi:hypothetical protein